MSALSVMISVVSIVSRIYIGLKSGSYHCICHISVQIAGQSLFVWLYQTSVAICLVGACADGILVYKGSCCGGDWLVKLTLLFLELNFLELFTALLQLFAMI